ncbi:MAG: hypothetical protein J6S60_04610 [Oscillospiraceae bacterium]|nr:hypothetical protein [Oscillospiraceae bacterium]
MAKDVKNMNLQEQAEAILQKAKEKGVSTNFFFVTTFKRYQVQMRILSDLEKEIVDTGATVTKEYVKGRRNIYTNPAIGEYNKTATAANGTVGTLISIVERLSEDNDKGSRLRELMSVMNDE